MRKNQRNKRTAVAAVLVSLALSACGNSASSTAAQSQEAVQEGAENPSQETEKETESESETEKETEMEQENHAEDGVSDPYVVTSVEDLAFAPGMEIQSDSFTGKAYLEPMIMNDEEYHFPQTNNIIFEPGARSSWHSHGGMVIVVTGGVGYYQEEGQPAQVIRTGDVIECAPGVKHWHGAAPDSWFSQMVIYDSHYTPENGEEEEEVPVTEEEYANLETEDYEGRVISEDNAFMFQKAQEALVSDTFSGPAYVSSIIGDDNVAGAPGLHYVVFGKGVINNWHTHEGGQILIATDGIGYHQIEGEPVEVLYPGDVALCPPGVKHWHGGSADTEFAHIAVNTNPERTGLEWFDRISDEEYHQLPAEKPQEETVSSDKNE